MLKYIMADRKVTDDTHHITQRRGNGQLRREIWVDAKGQVTRYNLACINHALHAGDNGRVVIVANQPRESCVRGADRAAVDRRFRLSASPVSCR